MSTTTAIETKERPILFSAPMIRAILAGKKTQTRRVVKPPRDWIRYYLGKDEANAALQDVSASYFWNCWRGGHGKPLTPKDSTHQWQLGDETLPQNFQPGERLWVRETFAPISEFDPEEHGVLYRADMKMDESEVAWKWKPSIFMPRWASRITLEIESVRVERLQDISEEDAIAEGFPFRSACACYPDGKARIAWCREHGGPGFESYWCQLNSCESWDSNPWVWVVGFRRALPV